MTSATLYHIDRATGAAHSPRPYSSASSSGTIGTAALARRPIGLTFPSSTPSSVTLRITASATGDYVVFALPYPVGSSFTVTKYGGALSPATSVATLTPSNNYVYDAASQHLFVMVAETGAVRRVCCCIPGR